MNRRLNIILNDGSRYEYSPNEYDTFEYDDLFFMVLKDDWYIALFKMNDISRVTTEKVE